MVAEGARAARSTWDSSNVQYPRDLRKVIAHARRLMRVLGEIDRARKDAWFHGRAEEVRGAVSLAIAEWRSGARDADAAEKALLSYVDSLHRSASKRLRSGLALACCDLDEVITAAGPGEGRSTVTFDSTDGGASQVTGDPTVPAGWVDTPEMLARFHDGLPLVEMHARAISRRVGPGCGIEDLCAFGREGLLDAARSFNECRGVPFDRWASLRVRSTMIDGVRRWGAIPLRARRRLEEGGSQNHRAEEAAESGPHASEATGSAYPPRWVALDEKHDAMAALGEAVQGPGLTPEDLVEREQLASLVRAIVSKLPTLERALIERSYFSGLTLAQAAAAVGVSRSCAHRAHARAVETIERELRNGDCKGAGGEGWVPRRL